MALFQLMLFLIYENPKMSSNSIFLILVFQGTFLGTFRCFLGTFEHFLGTFGGLSERECQGGSFDVSDVFFDYRVFVACCGPGGDDSVHSTSGTLSYV